MIQILFKFVISINVNKIFISLKINIRERNYFKKQNKIVQESSRNFLSKFYFLEVYLILYRSIYIEV